MIGSVLKEYRRKSGVVAFLVAPGWRTKSKFAEFQEYKSADLINLWFGVVQTAGIAFFVFRVTAHCFAGVGGSRSKPVFGIEPTWVKAPGMAKSNRQNKEVGNGIYMRSGEKASLSRSVNHAATFAEEKRGEEQERNHREVQIALQEAGIFAFHRAKTRLEAQILKEIDI